MAYNVIKHGIKQEEKMDLKAECKQSIKGKEQIMGEETRL